MITVQQQVLYILLFILFGMFLAVMYDILHYYLIKFKFKIVISYIIELIFWLGLAYLACMYMMKVSSGYLTIYTFGFFLLGALIHFYFFSKKFYVDIERFDKLTTRIYQRLKKIIIIIVFPKEVFLIIKKIIPKKKHITAIIKFLKLKILKFKKKKELDNENGQVKFEEIK